MSLLRLGFIWTVVLQTINALSLTSSLLDYGSFARALLDTYNRLREPIFEKVISVAGSLGISVDLVHLDFIFFYLLLSCNAYLALPLVLNRMDDAGKKLLEPHFNRIKHPWVIARSVFAHSFSWLPIGYSKESRLKMRQSLIETRNKGKLLLGQKRYAAFVVFYLSGIVIILIMALLAIPLWTLLLLAHLIPSLVMIAIMLALMPLAPFVNLAIFLFKFIWALLFPFRKGWRLQLITGRVLPAFRTLVLPWFIPLLTVFGGVFAIYTVDSLIDRGL